MYCLTRSVVAPCRGPSVQVVWRRCSSHHTPTYVPGVIHEVSARAHGSFRFSIRCDSARSPGRPPIVNVRHGVENSPDSRAFVPSGRLISSLVNVPGRSASAASVMLG